jgi:5-methylcytosine-specific restriction protein A
MPTAPALPCRAPLCPHRQPCPTHSEESLRGNGEVRKWYRCARWRHPERGLRARTLARFPLCVMCAAAGRITPTVDVDHVIPHRGDPVLFWDEENLQGLCKTHHTRKTGSGA